LQSPSDLLPKGVIFLNREKILLMDCNGETRPRIAFLLELAGYEICHVGGIIEAFNRALLSRETSERFCALVLNNPDLEHDLEFLCGVCGKENIGLPVIIVSHRLQTGGQRRENGMSFCHSSEFLQEVSRVAKISSC